MAESNTNAKANVNKKTMPSTKHEKSKKRRFGGQQDGARKKRKFNNFDIDLTKARNIILCSCQRFKEKSCGRDLKLVLTEYIEEYLKENNNKTSTNTQAQKDNEDNDLKMKLKEINNDNKTDTKEIDNENKQKDENEDDDLKTEQTNTNDNKIENNKAEISISDAINKELANLNNNEICEWIQGPDGLVIIDIINKNVKASKLLEFIFNKCHPNRPHLSPFVYKLYPLDITTFSRSDDIIKIAQRVIENINWDGIDKNDTYAINYKNRGNKQLDRKTIIDALASFVPKDYKVDLSNPKVVILLQTFGRTAGMSVIINNVFNKHKQYNLGNFEL